MRVYLIIFFLLQWAGLPQTPIESDLLQRGLGLEEAGQYEKALQVWSSAYTELDTPSLAIGREYIRLVTEQDLREYYESASAIYMWGLTAEEVEPNRNALKQELAMLEPLTDRITQKQRRSMLEEESSGLYRELLTFWQQLDPTPSTRTNERLLEHWERIAYAREHYNRQDDPPYGTDDRGAVYVQYGAPDRTKNGHLSLPRGVVQHECAYLSGCNPELMPNVVMDLDTHPYYEIWIYEKPNSQMVHNLVMMFGERPLDGLRRIDVIEDLIPASAFSLSDQRYSFESFTGVKTTPGENISPGMMIQFLYYRQLATTDGFFANRFMTLDHEWTGDTRNPNHGKFQGPMQEERSKTITRQNLNRAPKEMSTYEKEFPSIPLEAFHYRLLDEQNRPVTATFLESRPRQVFLEDMAFNEEVLFSDDQTTAEEAFIHYEFTHGLLVKGANGDVISRSAMPAELILDFQEDLPSSTVFTVPYLEKARQLSLYAELHNRHPDSASRLGDTPFPPDLRGLGKLESVLPEPLSNNPDQLEMADLVLGWQMRDNAPEGTLFPFVVANHREIPEGEELAVHLEIYNLQRREDGFTDFQIDYEVAPVRKMEWLRGRAPQEFTLTLDQRTSQNRFVENLEIRTRELPPGHYRLRFAATDHVSGQTTEREMEFRVVEIVDRETVSVN